MHALDRERLPRHVAIIMDGNRRWAESRSLPRTEGYRAGVRALRHTVEACGELGIRYLTVYAFSTENWERPRDEVGFLMDLLTNGLDKELPLLEREGVALRVLGDRRRLPARVNRRLDAALASPPENPRLVLSVALNYGGRAEIVQAARRVAADVANGVIRPDEIDESRRLYLHTIAIRRSSDLVIRTGGEHRISNFAGSSRTELRITPVYWPDFNRTHLLAPSWTSSWRQRWFGVWEAVNVRGCDGRHRHSRFLAAAAGGVCGFWSVSLRSSVWPVARPACRALQVSPPWDALLGGGQRVLLAAYIREAARPALAPARPCSASWSAPARRLCAALAPRRRWAALGVVYVAGCPAHLAGLNPVAARRGGVRAPDGFALIARRAARGPPTRAPSSWAGPGAAS